MGTPVIWRLFGEDILQSAQGPGQFGRRYDTQILDKAGFINGPDLFEQYETILVIETDMNSARRGFAATGHGRNQNGPDIIVHFRR